MSVIAVDGPVASGKGSLARSLAQHYAFHHLDTGILYRATAYEVLKSGCDPYDAEQSAAIASKIEDSVIDMPELRTAEVGALASVVAAHKPVRHALLAYQRAFARRPPGSVLDGRDIASRVCPDADVKFYVDASSEVRARRRQKELAERGEEIKFEDMLRQIHERDTRDATRHEAPLRRVEDAILLDTTSLRIEEVFKHACRHVDNVLKED